MIKVASYCRVSTDRDDQSNSFEAQQRYFREYIRNHSEWELFEIYADEGMTGTSTKKRTQFNRMIADAYEGKFQLIITKEVSRFSRNILDTIRYTRELKALGIAVRFVLDGINTMNPDAELYLSIMGSMAQEESRKTSSRVVWGQTRQMERGVVFGTSMLGYDVKDGKISINPVGAEIIRLIFQKYAQEQVGTAEIARYLTQEGYDTYRGNCNWTPSGIIKILHNEKYVGDLIQKKTYTPDYLTHEKRRNKGDVPLIRIENHHEAIISREVWNLAQERLKRNRKKAGIKSGHSDKYVFSGKIQCGECGANFVGRFRYHMNGTKTRRWSCAQAARGGTRRCSVGRLIRDDDATEMLKTAIGSLCLDWEAVLDEVIDLLTDDSEQGGVSIYKKEILLIQKKKERMLDCYFSGELSKQDMESMLRKYDERTTSLQNNIMISENRRYSSHALRDKLMGILRGEVESKIFLKSMLDRMTVFEDRHIELRLQHLSRIYIFSG